MKLILGPVSDSRFLERIGRTPCEVGSQHVGVAHWVDLGVPGDRDHSVRIFCATPEAAEGLAAAFVKCGPQRVNRQED